METNAQWRQVVGWPDYEVSSDGCVRRVSTGAILEPNDRGQVRLAWERTHRTWRKISQLVREAFKGAEPCEHKPSRYSYEVPAVNLQDLPRSEGEEWKQSVLPSFAVSNLGRVWSIRWRRVMSPVTHNGYQTVQVGNVRYRVHRLVALAFCKNEDPMLYDVVDHVDGNKRNNAASNLRWCTQAMNMQYYWADQRPGRGLRSLPTSSL
jgi:hypothetical protein